MVIQLSEDVVRLMGCLLQAQARIHTGSFKIRHVCERMLQAPGFMVYLLDVGKFARLSHSHLRFVNFDAF